MGKVEKFIIKLEPDNDDNVNFWLRDDYLTEEINGNKCLDYEAAYFETFELLKITFVQPETGHINTGFMSRREEHRDDYDNWYPECTKYYEFPEDIQKRFAHISDILKNSFHMNDDYETDLLIKNPDNYEYICDFMYDVSLFVNKYYINGVYYKRPKCINPTEEKIEILYFTNMYERYHNLFVAMYKGTTKYKNHINAEADHFYDIHFQEEYDRANKVKKEFSYGKCSNIR